MDPLLSGQSAAVAKKFNVSPKAIRDIWNRRTWTQETHHLWTEDEHPIIRLERKTYKSSLRTPCAYYQKRPSQPSCPQTSFSPECGISSCDKSRWQDNQAFDYSCSMYTSNIEQQNHFRSHSPWSQLLHPPSIPSADLPCIPSQNSAAHTPPSPLPSPPAGPPHSAADLLPHMKKMMDAEEEVEEEDSAGSPWAVAWGWSEADAAGWSSDAAERSPAHQPPTHSPPPAAGRTAALPLADMAPAAGEETGVEKAKEEEQEEEQEEQEEEELGSQWAAEGAREVEEDDAAARGWADLLPHTKMVVDAGEAVEEEDSAGSPWAAARGWAETDAAGWGSDAAERRGAGPLGAACAPDPFSLDWPVW
jgi:hypothetical protein